MANDKLLRAAFASGTYFSQDDDMDGPRPAGGSPGQQPVLSLAWDLGTVRPKAMQRHLTLAYDQVLSMRFFGTAMEPLWRSKWSDAVTMLEAVEASHTADVARTVDFDTGLVEKLTARAGDRFATLLSLVYRQVVGATQTVWNPLVQKPWVFMKEISSDGDVSTVDVVYPALPMFQYLYPEFFRIMLEPLLVYGSNGTKPYGLDMPYTLPWAPHHLGVWPVCDLPPQQQEQMPVEESGNMIIMLAALVLKRGDLDSLSSYWELLETWADYIVASLPDPGNQLCTDDFEGASPHNTNLAAKGIVALDALAALLRAKGDSQKAQVYSSKAAEFTASWMRNGADGDHYRIQFDLPGTWSQKYNLLYQVSLGLSAFPQSVFVAESAWYETKMHRCGVPLDNRHLWTKSDWSFWVAAFGTQEQLLGIVDGLYTFAHTTADRVPLSDLYDVERCLSQSKELGGFRARPVQGGLFAPMIVPAASQAIYA